MKIMLNIIAVLMPILLLQSCTELRSPHYVGDIQNPLTLSENLELESIWQSGDDVYHAGIVDSTNVIISTLKWNKAENIHVHEVHSLVITRLGNDYFINIKNDQEGLYSIYRISGTIPDNGSIALLTLNKDSLEKIITETGLNVKESMTGYTLDLDKNELDRFIQSHVNRIFPFSNVNIISNLAGNKKQQN